MCVCVCVMCLERLTLLLIKRVCLEEPTLRARDVVLFSQTVTVTFFFLAVGWNPTSQSCSIGLQEMKEEGERIIIPSHQIPEK